MDTATLQVVQSLVSNVGFPIVMCGAVLYMMNTTIKELTATISANTQAIAKLMTYLESKEA